MKEVKDLPEFKVEKDMREREAECSRELAVTYINKLRGEGLAFEWEEEAETKVGGFIIKATAAALGLKGWLENSWGHREERHWQRMQGRQDRSGEAKE